jgi:trehalose 6-phosphate synthase
MRYEAMMKTLHSQTIQRWFSDFVEALQDSQIRKVAAEPIVADGPWPRRVVQSGVRYH